MSEKIMLGRDGIVLSKRIEPTNFESRFLGRALSVESGQSLFHYMRVNRFKELLAAYAIYMRRLDLFEGDPHEGRFPAANSRMLSSLSKGANDRRGLGGAPLAGYRRFCEGKMRELTYVHCWFGSEFEDARMWREYGHDGSGVCIRTTARRLTESLMNTNRNFTINICGVSYTDDEVAIPEVISFMATCRKRRQFAHEREFRLIGQFGIEGWQIHGDTMPDHQLVRVDFERLFERVYVGPNVSQGAFEEIENLANKAAGCTVVHRSTLALSALAV